jgi:hypothetical protein
VTGKEKRGGCEDDTHGLYACECLTWLRWMWFNYMRRSPFSFWRLLSLFSASSPNRFPSLGATRLRSPSLTLCCASIASLAAALAFTLRSIEDVTRQSAGSAGMYNSIQSHSSACSSIQQRVQGEVLSAGEEVG